MSVSSRLVGCLCLALLAVPATRCSAQESKPTLLDRVGQGYRSLLSPDAAALLAAGGLSSYLLHQSEDPRLSARLLDQSSVDEGLDVGDRYGHGLTVGGGALLLVGAGRLGHLRMGEAGRDLLASFVVAASTTWAVKLSVHRRRPLGGPNSFPSGHTAVAFSTLPAIYRHGGRTAGMAASLLATATGAARMEEQRHYVSDVAFGAALGLASGLAVMGDQIRWQSLWSKLSFSGQQLRLSFDF